MIEFVFLDIDDTLLDFSWAECQGIHRAYAELGLLLTEEMYLRYHVVNQQWWQAYERGEISREGLLVARHRQMFEEYGLSADAEALERAYRRNLGIGHKFLPHAEALLAYLRPKYRLYVASNGVGETQYSRLESAGLTDFFDGVFISEELGAYKPMPEFFERSFAQIPGFRRERAILLGDSLGSDILGGRNAGLRTIWCNLRHQPPRADIRADYEVHDLREVMEIL